ncbi:MAG TPA: c-type cytochrome [Thermoanaerobaculia bacterium]|nr:c-type cytochrome [Thermoanaerobaculia bacterium]
MKKQLVAALILIVGCTTAQPPAPPSEFKNLQVLPRTITRDQLLATMRGFTRGLGVRCNHCHVVTATEPKEVLDFPADTKEEKRVARVMLRMVTEINGTWMHRVEEAEGEAEAAASAPAEPRVVCWTCHRGKTEPEMPPPPEARQGS